MKNTEDVIKEYYAIKAIEYDSTYRPHERKSDMNQISSIVNHLVEKKDVLEIACGTGYWTQLITRNANSILATDCNGEMLALAKQKYYGNCIVEFKKTDAYSLSGIQKKYTGGFCGFWWSHIPRSKRKKFLKVFHSKLTKNATVMIIDNNYVEGINAPIAKVDDDFNTYQRRILRNGSTYDVLKNFPLKKELIDFFINLGENVKIVNLRHYWLITYIHCS